MELGHVICEHHGDRKPRMIKIKKNTLGQDYICAVCTRIRTFNQGIVISVNQKMMVKAENGITFEFDQANTRLPEGKKIAFEVVYSGNQQHFAKNIHYMR